MTITETTKYNINFGLILLSVIIGFIVVSIQISELLNLNLLVSCVMSLIMIAVILVSVCIGTVKPEITEYDYNESKVLLEE